MASKDVNETQVSLKCIDIADSQTDVIVNTVGNNLNFQRSAVSKALLVKAGSTLQDEAQAVCPDGLKVGQVIVTSGGNLCCKKVYHCSPRRWSEGKEQCEGELRNLVDVCLEKAHADKMTSISFPAMSTGAAGVPREMVARVMFQQVEQFNKSHRQTTLKTIVFVLYHGDQKTIKVFREYMENKSTSLPPSKTLKQATATSDVIHGANDREMTSQLPSTNTGDTGESKLNLVKPFQNPNDAAATVVSPPADYSERIIDVTTDLIVRVKQGDITKQTTDAIVNTTNNNFSAAGGLAGAIFRAGGPSLIEECKHIGKIKGGVAVTKAGGLPCQYVIHIVAPTADSDWYDLIKKALKLAEKENIQSISFPALGTGLMSVNPDIMATQMGRAIYSHAQKHNKTIQDIHICIFDANITPNFHTTLKIFFENKRKSSFTDIGAGLQSSRLHHKSRPILPLPIYGDETHVTVEGIAEAVAKILSADLTNIRMADPSNWDEMASGPNHLGVVKLGDSSREYQEIVNTVQDDIEPGNIKKIERIQNRKIHKIYQTIKSMMKTPGERTLYHGTRKEAVDSINVQGFDRQRHGENGIKFGKGTYFAKSAGYSKYYAVADNKGLCYMYQCKVLTGEYTMGNENMLAPPPRNPKEPKTKHVLYDTLVNDVKDPTIFVVFQDNQACPEYLITFKS